MSLWCVCGWWEEVVFSPHGTVNLLHITFVLRWTTKAREFLDLCPVIKYFQVIILEGKKGEINTPPPPEDRLRVEKDKVVLVIR